MRRVAQAAALYLQENKQDHKPVVIGHDLRFLSGRFSRAIAEILVHNGIPVWFIEPVVPTPMPVSYTHLDVYKRQGHDRPGQCRPADDPAAALAGEVIVVR